MTGARIPRSRSLPARPVPFEEDIAVANGKSRHKTIQEAVDAAGEGGTVVVGPGTYTENVDIKSDYADISLVGSGNGTIIDGQDDHAIHVKADDTVIRNLAVKTTTGQGNDAYGIEINFSGGGISDPVVDGVTVLDSDSHGIHAQGAPGATIRDCNIEKADASGIYVQTRAVIHGCYVGENDGDIGQNGIRHDGQDGRVENNFIWMVGNNGIQAGGDDQAIEDNTVVDPGGDGILATGTDQLIATNVITGATGTGLDYSGATGPKSVQNLVDGTLDDNTGGGSGAPTDAAYVTTSANATLTNETLYTDLAVEDFSTSGSVDEVPTADASGGLTMQPVYDIVASGTGDLASGSLLVDTGVASGTTDAFFPALNPNGSGMEIAGDIFDSSGNVWVEIEETDTSLSSGTIRYKIVRV